MKLFDLLFTRKPKGTDALVHIEDIIIPRCFRSTRPKRWKMERAIDYYKAHGKVDKPLLVEVITNESGRCNKFLVIDQYTRYLVLKEMGVKRVPIKYSQSLQDIHKITL